MNSAEKLLEPTIFFKNIHQVTIEIGFRKSLAQERFKSNLEFRNQIIVSSIKLRKGLRSQFSSLFYTVTFFVFFFYIWTN